MYWSIENRSFSSADGDNVWDGNMFPDSDSAKSYRQGATLLSSSSMKPQHPRSKNSMMVI